MQTPGRRPPRATTRCDRVPAGGNEQAQGCRIDQQHHEPTITSRDTTAIRHRNPAARQADSLRRACTRQPAERQAPNISDDLSI
ncbi:hypothetical protein GCM10009789_77480 [Kribbella sancticallisti]|uniref:Uncharacterized protein n=1 Tax=Kribbella sancticallisti TaxID=460087 RepID=A0ABP4QHE0_9ACTN